MITRRELLIAGTVGALSACIDTSVTKSLDGGTADLAGDGPPPDLATDSPDLSASPDLAQSPEDLAQASTDMVQGPGDLAHSPDLAQSSPDLASSCTGSVHGGVASTITLNSKRFVSAGTLFVCRDAGGLYALTAVCTHAGCTVGDSGASGFLCPCHGSRFDSNGNVTQGPASSALVHFALCVDGSGNVLVNPSKRVSSSTRT